MCKVPHVACSREIFISADITNIFIPKHFSKSFMSSINMHCDSRMMLPILLPCHSFFFGPKAFVLNRLATFQKDHLNIEKKEHSDALKFVLRLKYDNASE